MIPFRTALILPVLAGALQAGPSFSYSNGGTLSFTGGIGTSLTFSVMPVNSFFDGINAFSCHPSCTLQLTTGPLIAYTPGAVSQWDFGAGGTFSVSTSGGGYLDLNHSNTFNPGIDATGMLVSGAVNALSVFGFAGSLTTNAGLSNAIFETLTAAAFGYPPLTPLSGSVTISSTGTVSGGACPGANCGAFNSGSGGALSGNATFSGAVPEPSLFWPCALLLGIPALRRFVRS